MTRNLLGVTRKARGELDFAESEYRKALELYELVHPVPDLYRCALCFNLGTALEQAGREEQALELYDRAMAEMRSIDLSDHPFYARFEKQRAELEERRALRE